jgi:hypothetical protein
LRQALLISDVWVSFIHDLPFTMMDLLITPCLSH